MEKVRKAYSVLRSQTFGMEDINKMGSRALIDHGIFSDKILREWVTSLGVSNRLWDPSNKSYLPNPFVFSPSRKACFAKLLPFPEDDYTIIEGYSQAGKSNFACHLALIYRMKPQNQVVLYITDPITFNDLTYNFLKNEFFYWFFEEIEGSLMAQHIMKSMVSEKNEKYFEPAIDFFIEMAISKGKNITVILDQYDRLEVNTPNKFMKVLVSLAHKKIFVSTNTDQNIMKYKQNSISRGPTLVLSESENLIPKEEMLIIIKKLFHNQNVELAESIFEKTKGNLSLVFLFYKHCAVKGFTGQDVLQLTDEYENFVDDYIKVHQPKHYQWRKKEIENNQVSFEKFQDLMMFLDSDFAYDVRIPEEWLDHRYVFSTNKFFLKSINPLISTMFRQIYWSPSRLEKFLNQYGDLLSGSTFGGMYEFYMISKIKELAKKRIHLQIKIKNILINFDHESESTVIYVGDGKRFEKITYNRTKGNKKVFYETTQENFPLLDCVIHTDDGTAFMINFRKDADSLTESYNKYYELYKTETKKQLSNEKTFKFLFYFKII